MLTTAIFPGRYVQGAHALSILGEEAARFGTRPLVVEDAFVVNHLHDSVTAALADMPAATFEQFGGECSQNEIDQLVEQGRKASCDVVIGIGGGKTLDASKAAAHALECPIIIIPTIASTDAPCSALSVIYTSEGAFERYLILPRNPDVVLVDTAIIARAPVRFLVAGIGDALSTWFEAESCQIKRASNMTGRPGPMSAHALAGLCYDTILEYGMLAKAAVEAQSVTPALEHVVEANTLLSGLGFESGGLAACHAIHNGLTVLKQTHDYWHGEKVAIGVLAALFLTGKPTAQIDEVFTFCASVGLPTTLADLGLKDVTDEQLMQVAEGACAPGETIHNEPVEVSPEAVFWALRTMDVEGRRRATMA
ncbi:glycerol dehydrogenase [Pseudaestuariivita rosea]|uniref:glycerol dehydrogenase n=1 Tax=Pseudaestuariivita rosea TaxID=2763263 RepID=UPI001ABB8D7B|nr:glycerol dehydrogenase [Pseudaestuariivita rosea]